MTPIPRSLFRRQEPRGEELGRRVLFLPKEKGGQGLLHLASRSVTLGQVLELTGPQITYIKDINKNIHFLT